MSIPENPRRPEGEQMLIAGKSVREVAAAVGAGERTVQRWAAQLGISRGRGERGPSKDLSPIVQEVIGCLIDGELVCNLSDKFSLTESRIRQIRGMISDEDFK